MTDFLRLKIEIYAYRSIAEKAEFFASVWDSIEDAVTGRHGDGDWFGEVQDFFSEVRSAWKNMEEREAEGAVGLNHDAPEHYLADVQPDQIGSMGLVEVLTLLRKATAAEPQIEEYNRTFPGDQSQKPDPKRDQRFIDAYQKGLILPALKRLNALLAITPTDIEAVLSLKPFFDSLSVEEFRRWNGWEPMDLPEGGQALHVPYPDYHPVVSQWFGLLYQTPFYIDPYAALPEDPTPDGVPFSVMGAHFPPEYFERATLDQVRRYMLLCTRGEKFCDGHIAGEFEGGVIQAAFARLESLSRSAHPIDFSEPHPLERLRGHIDRPEYGLTASASHKGTHKFLRITDLTEEGVDWGSVPYCSPDQKELVKKILKHGDIIVARIGATTGKGFLVKEPPPAVFASYCIRLRTKPTLSAGYLAQFLRTELYWKQIDSQKGGRLKGGVNIPILEELRLPVPDIDTQHGLVRTLEAIQAARLARLREIELERERKAALMAHLFAYGTQNEPRCDTPLGPLPESWEVVPMGKVCKFLSGGTPSKSRPDFWQGTIPWVSGKDLKHPRLSDVIDHISAEGASVGSKIAPAHSILILVRGMGLAKDIPMSQIARPMAFNQDLKAICPPDEATGDYLYWALQQIKPDFERHIGMAAHGTRKIAGSVLDNLLIPLPKVDERKVIADALWAAHACGIALEAEAKLLDELFRATLEELMSGRLSVAPLLAEVVA